MRRGPQLLQCENRIWVIFRPECRGVLGCGLRLLHLRERTGRNALIAPYRCVRSHSGAPPPRPSAGPMTGSAATPATRLDPAGTAQERLCPPDLAHEKCCKGKGGTPPLLYFFPAVNVAPLAQAAMVFQFGSFLVANCRPPLWNASPPASGASGWISNLLFSGSSVACTILTTVS